MLHFYVNTLLGNAHAGEPDTRSEETDIDEPLSPSAREIGFSFSKNASSSLSALAQSPPECLSPSKEAALKDELSPVTEVPSDIRKLKFNIGASPSDFILEESECEDAQLLLSSSAMDSQKLFKPISESAESDEQETVVEQAKSTSAAGCETVDQSVKSADRDEDAGVLRESHDAGDSSDEERDFVDDGAELDRMTLLSFDNIAYEDPVSVSDVQDTGHAKQQECEDIIVEEQSSSNQLRCHKVSISSDSDSEKLIDAEMVDIQSMLQTQFESNAALKITQSLVSDHSETVESVAHEDEKEYELGAVVAEPHESIRGTYDAEVLNVIESQRSNSNFSFGANTTALFSFSRAAETGSAAGTLAALSAAAADDVMKISTSSDASGEATILAATYDLDLGAVSRVVATYDMSPDSVDKTFVVDKRSKILQSSPDDEVFETDDGIRRAAKTEDSSDVAEDFDANEMIFELVKADDVDKYEAYLEVMQQNRAAVDKVLGTPLDFHAGEPAAVDETLHDIALSLSVQSTACEQPDLIQGMPRNVDVDVLPGQSIYSPSEMQDQSGLESGHVAVYNDDPARVYTQHLENLEECSASWDAFNQLQCDDSVYVYKDTKQMPVSFGKGALESDNMYQVFQQDASISPGGDEMPASSEDACFGLEHNKHADDAMAQYAQYKLDVDQDEDFDSDFLAESAEPELMALSVEKDDEEGNLQVDLLGSGDDCQAALAVSSDSWRAVDSQCLDRPLSPLPDNAYRILDDTDDAHVARHVLHSSTADSETEVDISFKQVAQDDDLHSELASAILTQVMDNARAAAANVEDETIEYNNLQNSEADDGFFQVKSIPDLGLQSCTFSEEVHNMDEAVLPGDEYQLRDSEDVDCSGEIRESLHHHIQGHCSGIGETLSESVDYDNLLDGNHVCQKASEFVDSLVREAQVEAENVSNKSQETTIAPLAGYSVSGLCRFDEVSEELYADSKNISDVVSNYTVSSEDTVLLSYDQTETSKLDALNGTLVEWNGMEQTSLDDYGDSSSVDSFATVVPCHQEVIEDRMEDLASVSSSFHSDLHSSYLEEQPEPLLCLDARDYEFMQGENEDSSSSEHLEAMRDDLDSSVVELVPCYESPIDSNYGILDDDFDHPMMMLATIKEEDERSSISGRSGKTGSSSERVDGVSDSDKQASSGDLHAEYPCRRMIGKSADKDDVSVSSSLLEFETLEKEMQDRTSLDSLAKLGSQHSVAEKSSEASSSLLEFERIEKDMQDRTSHDSLTRLGSLQSVAEKGSEKDNVSVSSSLAEFETLEREMDVNETTNNISVHTAYGMIGSTTSLNAFLMDDSANQTAQVTHISQLSDESFGFDEQFESEARAVVSMLEAGALPVMQDHMSANTEPEPSGADVEMMPAVTDEELNADYPEYQDIVQIIRKASETAHENVEDEGRRSYYHPALHEPDVDSLDERYDTEITNEDAVMYTDGRGFRHDIDNDSLQEDTVHVCSDQVVPSGDSWEVMFPVDVMETSADSIEGAREEPALDRSADSLELRLSLVQNTETLMYQSVDSLGTEDALGGQPHESFDADSLHELSALADNSGQPAGVLMASVESGAWSQSDSLLSNTETLKSSGSSHDDSMRMSPESPNALVSTTEQRHDNHVSLASAEPQAPSCYCHSPTSPTSSFPSQEGNHAENMSGN